MLEEEYWSSLEYRLCGEMIEMPDCRALGLWCDGIKPREFVLTGASRHVRGTCWIGFGPKDMQQWQFKLVLKGHISKASEIHWPYYMPPADVTGWLRVFPKERRIEIEPRAGRRAP